MPVHGDVIEDRECRRRGGAVVPRKAALAAAGNDAECAVARQTADARNVGDEEAAVRFERQASRLVETTRDRRDEAGPVNPADDVIAKISDEEVAFLVERQRSGRGELSIDRQPAVAGKSALAVVTNLPRAGKRLDGPVRPDRRTRLPPPSAT